MIIKSHIRGGYMAASHYLKEVGKNEAIRLVSISDTDAKNLDEAFHNMWAVASRTKATKPLHHISINPHKDERLTDDQVQKIITRCEQKYGYKSDSHQRVIVEHIKDGRQHFHVMWNRINLTTSKAVWPGEHWKKSKQASREMETELGLKRPVPKKVKRLWAATAKAGQTAKHFGRYKTLKTKGLLQPIIGTGSAPATSHSKPTTSKTKSQLQPQRPVLTVSRKRTHKPRDTQNTLSSEKGPIHPSEMSSEELLAWAWENGRADILALFGVFVDFEP